MKRKTLQRKLAKKVHVRHISSSNVNLLKDKITSMDETINRIKNLTKISSADAKTRKEDSEPPALPTNSFRESQVRRRNRI